MTLRHREQDFRQTIIGTYISPIGPTTFHGSKTDGFWRVCDDTIGAYPSPTDFSLMEQFTYYPTLTCTSPGGYQWLQQPISTKPAPWDPRHYYSQPTLLDLNNKAWEILAKTNPSIPHVSIPTFIGELKDLPGLVKGYGDGLLKAVANGYLSWRWAIKPMISDLGKLCRFVKAVDDRTLMLQKLAQGKTLRKRVNLGTVQGRHTYGSSILESSPGGSLTGTFHDDYSMKEWGTAQWKLLPNSVLPQLGYGPLRNMARKLTFGFTDHEALATAWELTPWSWLADWFGNTGDLIAATNNSVGCTWQNICYMRTSSVFVDCTNITGDSWMIAGLENQRYIIQFTRKERYTCVPTIPAPFPYLPILTNGQWSILAALAAQRL
jgi:hypothetical protein